MNFHISQSWYLYEKGWGGHIILLFWDGGDKVRKIDSSHAAEYNDKMVDKNRWFCGGCTETVLTLPLGPDVGDPSV